jgi:hypothetical protein
MSPFVALLLGGGFWSPVDLASPNAVGVLQARMLSLSEGMTEFEVRKRLGLENQAPYMFGGSPSSHFAIFQVGQAHVLILDSRHDWKRDTWVFKSAFLEVDWDRIDPPDANSPGPPPDLNIFPFSALTLSDRTLD